MASKCFYFNFKITSCKNYIIGKSQFNSGENKKKFSVL